MLLSFILISLVGGTILGIGLRAYDNWEEKKRAEEIAALALEEEITNKKE